MSKKNRGKEFELKFKSDWERCFPNTFILRLKDDMSGYYGTGKNPCDFICFPKDKLFMIETKAHYTNRFPLLDFSQYSTLLSYRDCQNTNIGLLIWFIDYCKVLYFPLDSITQMKKDGLKSINLNKQDEMNKYKHIEIPSTKKRVFLDSDYTILIV